MFAFDIIKHNKVWIYQGQGTEANFGKDGKILSTTRTGTPLSMLAYFIEKPSINISQNWN